MRSQTTLSQALAVSIAKHADGVESRVARESGSKDPLIKEACEDIRQLLAELRSALKTGGRRRMRLALIGIECCEYQISFVKRVNGVGKKGSELEAVRRPDRAPPKGGTDA